MNTEMTRTIMIVTLCMAVALLAGCPAQQTDEAVPPAPAGDEMAPGPDEADGADQPAADHVPGEHMDDDDGPGQHMDDDDGPGQHMDDEHMHGDGAGGSSDASLSGEVVDGTRVVEVEAKRYEFIPDPIVVEKGQPVRLEVTATDVTHGFGLDAMDIDVTLPPNETQTIEFTPDEAGQFHVHCTEYCGPGHDDMHATLIVSE